jgi:hypothetical protein
MPARPWLPLLAVPLALLGPEARAAEAPPPQKIVYDLALDGQSIGTREVSIRYLDRDGDERRLLEATTEATVRGARLVGRSTGQSSARGATFNAVTDNAGARAQVQGVEQPGGGWRITILDPAGERETTYARGDVRLTSLDLLDPGRTPLLAGGGELTLLLVETGDLLTGTLDAGQTGVTKVGGEKVAVTRYTATGALGSARFDVDENGLLVRSELRWLGGTVSAVARTLPPPRSYGAVETIDSLTPGVIEDEL